MNTNASEETIKRKAIMYIMKPNVVIENLF